MIARKETTTITMKQDQEELIEERVGQQQQPERSRLASKWTGKRNGHMRLMKLPRRSEMAIKSNYPLLQVAVYDRFASVETIIELPEEVRMVTAGGVPFRRCLGIPVAFLARRSRISSSFALICSS